MNQGPPATTLTAPLSDPAGSAERAVLEAQSALEDGRFGEARRWLGRAARLLPDEVTIQLMLAAATVPTDPACAVAVLERLAGQHPTDRGVQVALAASLLRAGRPADAASCLGALLGCMAPPDDPAFPEVAAAICAASEAPGWVGLDGRGVCRAQLVGTAPRALVGLELDGLPAGVVRPGQGAQVLREGWSRAARLMATVAGRPLLGSGLDPSRFARVDGFVDRDAHGGVQGWARLPADPATPPALFLRQADGTLRPVNCALAPVSALPPTGEAASLQATRWYFAVAPAALHGLHRAEIVDAAECQLWGSPLLLDGEQAAARTAAQMLGGGMPPAADGVPDRFRPLPASLLPAPPMASPSPIQPQRGVRRSRLPPCDVVVPVYGGAAELELCLASLAATLPRTSRLVLVDDGSPDPRIRARLATAAGPGVSVVQHARPRGFPAAVNAGLAELGPLAGRDVVILNADTVVSRHWLARLSAAAHSDPAIGSCTPLTNDGTIVSYPTPGTAQDAPDTAALAALNQLCWQANGAAAVPIPTGVGFCMLIKGACWAQTGPLREDVFAQGYGEENDWCLRAAHLGWRHVAAPGVFVAHSGGRSFGAAKSLLMARNAAVLERLHPGYQAYVTAALAADPLLPARRRIDRLQLRPTPGTAAVALVTHDAGGGVARHVARRGAALLRSGRRPIVLTPQEDAPGICHVAPGAGEPALPNLHFSLPAELDDLVALLREAGVVAVEIHHLLNHHEAVSTLPALLGVPYDVYIHDYGHWCPRISLTSRGNRYCGEPLAPAECEECIADLGSRYDPSVSVLGLRRHSTRLLGRARRVAVSCEDVASRIRRQFPAVRPVIEPWEDPPPPPHAGWQGGGGDAGQVHVVVAGAIGIEKGYDVLLACARDAARRALPLRFTVVGHTVDDDRLMATGRVFVTGLFAEDEGPALVRAQAGVIGFVPSVCPETWCFALSLLLDAGLRVLGFGLGAQGERIGQSGRGWLLPPGLLPAKINDALVNHGRETIQWYDTTVGPR